MNNKALERAIAEQFVLRLHQIEVATKTDGRVLFNPDLRIQVVDNQIRALYTLATQETLEAKYPADWWQAFKERWFPHWLLEYYPVKFKQVVAVHKFPELEVPHTLGKEYVELKIVDPDKLFIEEETDFEESNSR